MTSDVFGSFALDPRLIEPLAKMGFENPTPIQTQAIPVLLEGHDVIGRARTGSGKTAAFGLPLLELVKSGERKVRALVLAPTRELALQVSKTLVAHAAQLPVRILSIYGGAPYPPQFKALSSGVDVVVGTPGRVIDHLNRGSLDLSGLKLLVLDEADEMLRMGFVDDVERVLADTPRERQVALFSATMPPEIRRVANTYLRKPVEVQVEQGSLSVAHIEQGWILAPERYKFDALMRVLRYKPTGASLIFTQTRRASADVAERLAKNGIIADALHGDMNQRARERVLGGLRSKLLDVVVATDVAARGIDVNHLTHVINFDLPRETESYVHRIGRTGRAGRKGSAISLVTPRERRRLFMLEKRLKVRINHLQIPTDADIARRQQERLKELLKNSLEEEQGLKGAQELVESFIEAEGWTPEALAVAAVKALAHIKNVSLKNIANDNAPRWSKPPAPAPKPPQNPVGLAIALGRKSGVQPEDIVGALTNEFGLEGRHIGRITVLSNKVLVTVPEHIAEKIVKADKQIFICGKAAQISILARRAPAGTRSGGPPGDQTPFRPGRPSAKKKKDKRKKRSGGKRHRG